MDFLAVVVLAKIFKQSVGRLDLADSFGPEKRGQAVLPKVMEPLDLALCLGRRGILQAHSIESQGGTQLGERVRVVGVKKAVVVHIQGQRQPVLQEGTREEVVV